MRIDRASVAVALLTLLALAVRAWGFRQGLLGDELFAYDEIHGQDLGGVLREVRDSIEVSPPLFFLLASLSAKLGDPTVWIRLPSLLLGTALVPLTFVLGRMTVGRGAGLCAAALVTVSPFAIFYADEARPYATLTFFAALSACCLLCALRGNRRRWWIAYAVSTALVVYSHYTGVFVLFAQTLWALWFHRDRMRAIVVATAGALVLFLPWLSLVDSKGQLAVYGPFEPDFDAVAVIVRVLAGHPFIPLRDTPGLLALAAAGLACLAAPWFVITRRRRVEAGDSSGQPHALLLAALALATPAGVLVASAVAGYDLFNARNLSASLPAAAILLGWLLTAPPRPVGTVLATLAVLAVAVGGAMTLDQDRQRPDARAAAAFVRTHAQRSDDLVYVAPAASISNRPLDPYLPGWRRPVFGDPKGYAAAFARAAADGRRVVVVFPSIAPIRALVTPPKSLTGRFRLAEQGRFAGFGGGLAVRIFEPAAATR